MDSSDFQIKRPKLQIESSSESENGEGEASDQEEMHNLQELKVSQELGGLFSLIAMNQTYLDLITRLARKVELLIEKNREEQKRIKDFLSNNSSYDQLFHSLKRSSFVYPYFKDKRGMVPNFSDEFRDIMRHCKVNPLMKEAKYWYPEDVSLLKQAVVVQLMREKTIKLVEQRDALEDKMEEDKKQKKLGELKNYRKEIETIDRRLNKISECDDESILESASYDNIDWAKMSVKVFKDHRPPIQLKVKWLNEQAPQWNNLEWTDVEDELLMKVDDSLWNNWDVISEELGTDRPPYSCFVHFMQLKKLARAKTPWTPEEDEQLRKLVDKFTFGDYIAWKKVASHMPNRDWIRCETRYSRSLDPNLVRGRWSKEEDLLLVSAINKYGPYNWRRIAKAVPGRTCVQCRERWVDQLDTKNSKAPWTNDEDEVLLMGVQAFGRSSYSKIAKLIPNRNTNTVKNRVIMLHRWKAIETRQRQKNKKKIKTVDKSLSAYKAKAQKASNQANQTAYLSQKAFADQRSLSLSYRLGHGSFIVDDDNQNIDYSVAKQDLVNKFGQWVITEANSWVRLTKNPNEYGESEFYSVLDSLPDDKRQILEQFLRERAERRQFEMDLVLSEEERIEREEQHTERVIDLMNDVLVVEQKDLVVKPRKKATKKRAASASEESD